MSLTCTRCEGSGFLNLHQCPEEILEQYDETGDVDVILKWIEEDGANDVGVCDCCGDGETWHHDEPGCHYERTFGDGGPDCMMADCRSATEEE